MYNFSMKNKHLINNALDIKSRDNATKIASAHRNHDLYKLLSKADFSKIFSNNEFSLKISNDNLVDAIDELEATDNFNSFITICDGTRHSGFKSR